MYSGYMDEELKRMFEEKLNGNDSSQQTTKRKKIDCGELVKRDDGVYRSSYDFPEYR